MGRVVVVALRDGVCGRTDVAFLDRSFIPPTSSPEPVLGGSSTVVWVLAGIRFQGRVVVRPVPSSVPIHGQTYRLLAPALTVRPRAPSTKFTYTFHGHRRLELTFSPPQFH